MKFFKKTDIIIISVLIVLAVGGYFAYKAVFQNKQAVAEIYYGTELIKTVDLSEHKDYYYIPPQRPHVKIHIHSDGTIAFEESDCPDKLCIHSGRLGMVGQSAACLPNKIIIKIVPKGKHKNEDIDITVGK